jgi:hypothetical protein
MAAYNAMSPRRIPNRAYQAVLCLKQEENFGERRWWFRARVGDQGKIYRYIVFPTHLTHGGR